MSSGDFSGAWKGWRRDGDPCDLAVEQRFERSSPVWHNGHLYFANDSSAELYCLKAASGEAVWEQQLQPRPDRIYASPVLVGDRIYFPTRNRGVFVIEAKPEFKLLAQNPPLDPTHFNGSMAASGGQFFLRSDCAVYCIAGK